LKYYHKVDCAEVVSEWAKREGQSISQILHERDPLLRELPSDTVWFKVSINKDDLSSLKVINTDYSWQYVSDCTGEIKRIVQNLPILLKNPPRFNGLMDDRRTPVQQYVHDLIRKLQKFRDSAWDAGHNLTLILISSTKAGPFTILEGNHTAVGLYFKYFIDDPELPYPTHNSYVGISTSMDKCRWYRPS